MSFTKEQKQKITEQSSKNACCRRAIIYGMLTARGYLNGDTVELLLGDSVEADFTLPLIKEFFGKEADVKQSKGGGRQVTISFKSNSAKHYLEEMQNSSRIAYKYKCSLCKASFLKGIFISSGRISAPKKRYLLEFSLGDRVDLFSEFFAALGLIASFAERKNEKILYFKNSETISDFFAVSDMASISFEYMNAKIENEIRNEVKRIANCEMNNINKAVDAATKHIRAIEALTENNMLGALPEELRETAELRLKYPDLSISQLAKVAVPSISKPGLSHRLNRIVRYYEKNLLGLGE